jgi:predicted nucleic acid-binding protein
MFCLDNNPIVFALNKCKPEIDHRLQAELAAGAPLLVPTPVLFELRYGIAKSDRREISARVLDAFLAEGFKLIAFDADDANEAGASARRGPRDAQPLRVLATAGPGHDRLGRMNQTDHPAPFCWLFVNLRGIRETRGGAS